ncbi:MAG TPA: ParB N-terminal domain-containing protein [Pirellulales bacterium]|nr:ParB N-terminal domain-containing protein [Pirellulales bacterium]
MNTIENTSVQPKLIAVSKLDKSPRNARRTTPKMGMDELKASLLAHGLMQNLVVTDQGDGVFHVIAGGRRLEAIRSLQAEGKLPDDFAVPCQVVADEHGLEMSLAENTVRLAMHPADEFEAFAALIDKGESAAQVAERFGVDESHVLKRMKLARVAPQLLKQYREGSITLECLKAFSITDDHRRQVKVFKSLQEWQKEDPSEIRAALTDKLVEASSKLARFVGLEAYAAAGGPTRADLFGDEVYLEKPAILHKLAEEKLEAIRKELEAEGWGWININPEREYDFISRCSRIKPRLIDAPSELVEFKERLDAELEQIEQSIANDESEELLNQQELAQGRLDEVEEKLAAFVGFDTEQKGIAGCYVSIAQDGTPFVDKGLVKPEHRKELARLLKDDSTEAKSANAKPKNPLSESLRRDLAASRSQVAQVEIARNPAIAFDLLVFHVATVMLSEDCCGDGPNVAFLPPRADSRSEETPSPAAKALEAIEESLPSGWLKPKLETARFEAFRSLPQEAKQQLLAYCVALTLQPKLGPAAGDEATAYDAALSFTGASVADYWRPNGANFLSRVSRDQLLAIARETLGEPWAQSRARDSKASLVGQMERAFADPGRPGQTPEQAERLKSWLPAGMAFGSLPTPKQGKGKKTRKAA